MRCTVAVPVTVPSSIFPLGRAGAGAAAGAGGGGGGEGDFWDEHPGSPARTRAIAIVVRFISGLLILSFSTPSRRTTQLNAPCPDLSCHLVPREGPVVRCHRRTARGGGRSGRWRDVARAG